jgi:hypothetical protein
VPTNKGRDVPDIPMNSFRWGDSSEKEGGTLTTLLRVWGRVPGSRGLGLGLGFRV